MNEVDVNMNEVDVNMNETDLEDEEAVNLTYPFSVNTEDYCGTTLDDAIKDKNHPPNTEWPNDIYREFMEIVMEYQLSNSCGDRIIKLINKSKNVEKMHYRKIPRKVVNFLILVNFLT